jgi:hypothetical protein
MLRQVLHLAFVAVLLAVPATAQESRPSIDFVSIPGLALADRAKVDAELGRPTSCEQIRYGPKCLYRRGAVEIVFIGGAADWITVYLPLSAPFAASTLRMLGLAERRPQFANAYVQRWTSFEGLREVSLFANTAAGTVQYAYVKVRTP